MGGAFSHKNTPEGHTETHKGSLFPYKHVSGRNGDHGWLRMTNAFILCDLLRKAPKGHAPTQFERSCTYTIRKVMHLHNSHALYINNKVYSQARPKYCILNENNYGYCILK